MRAVSRRLAAAWVFVAWAHVAWAQTADEVVARSLAAIGGRAALGKLKSRLTTGTITLSTPAGDIEGSVELLNAAPNKSRSLTIQVTKVEHNVRVDETIFSKPASP